MKAGRKKLKEDDPAQSRAFIDKAREVEADEDKSKADQLIGRLASTKPEPRRKNGTGSA